MDGFLVEEEWGWWNKKNKKKGWWGWNSRRLVELGAICIVNPSFPFSVGSFCCRVGSYCSETSEKDDEWWNRSERRG
ncbi:hypothetical protein CEXT_106001 [Caerostris extrusa]|uniref:Uncharacterized protein n=1 Tax=Caerostris extrusa TaxID=172846 RepID=A0AAV4UN15_CAEEX|nr:hypothetical protein CEXT_106001 [Caerostris extrusa]